MPFRKYGDLQVSAWGAISLGDKLAFEQNLWNLLREVVDASIKMLAVKVAY